MNKPTKTKKYIEGKYKIDIRDYAGHFGKSAPNSPAVQAAQPCPAIVENHFENKRPPLLGLLAFNL